MTRYNPPLPQTAGRPATPGQQPVRTAPAGQQPKPPLRPSQAAFPNPSAYSGASSQAAYPGQGYATDTQAASHRDPYAALRPDGYGYTPPQGASAQPADPYGLAGYTAPQPPAPGYGAQPASPSSYGQGGFDPFPTTRAPSQPQTLGSPSYAPPGPSFGSQPSAYGNGYAPAPSPASHAPQGDSWSQGLSVDPRDYGNSNGYASNGSSYGAQGQPGHWDSADPYFGDHAEPALAPPPGYQAGHPGAAQQGSFDQSYADDDVPYEDEPRRSNWKKVVGLVASTVLVGGVLTVAYTSIMGSNSGEPTPVVKSASGPSKVKPSEPGGKQFAYTDSKVMGRLGEPEEPASGAEAANSGVKKVPVVVVGRDGTIQPPSASEAEPTRATVAAPGLTIVDGLGGFGGPQPSRNSSQSSSSSPPASNAAPPVKMVTAPEADSPAPKKTASTSGPSDDSDAAPTKAIVRDVTPKKEKVAAVTPPPSASASGPQPTGAGYVAVLASVPASGSSRIDALKQFADMQQKYTTILQNKTPDVQEANLGAKGTYHRLLVGPPGSREAASQVCTQLKAEGYSGCWVTAY